MKQRLPINSEKIILLLKLGDLKTLKNFFEPEITEEGKIEVKGKKDKNDKKDKVATVEDDNKIILDLLNQLIGY